MPRIFYTTTAVFLAIGTPSESFAQVEQATTQSTETAVAPARHSVRPTGRDVYYTFADCDRARLTGNIAGYGPSLPAVRSAEAQNKRVGLVPMFSDQDLAEMRARGESTQACVLEDTSVYSDGRGHDRAQGQNRRGRLWVVKNLEDLYSRLGQIFDWWCANLIPEFPQPREDSPQVNVPATEVTTNVEQPDPLHVYRRVQVIVHDVPEITHVMEPPVIRRQSGQINIPAPTQDVVYQEEDCGCAEEPAPAPEPRRTYTVREWHRCGDQIGDITADRDGWFIVTYEE